MADMMGSMFAAHIVASEIAHQNWMNRFEAESRSRLADDNATLRQRDAAIVARHNQLAKAYNHLFGQAKALEQDFHQQAATIDRLRTEKAAADAEIERLKFQLLDVSTELAVLRDLDKQLHPEAYPLG